jgi:hypothetical protein
MDPSENPALDLNLDLASVADPSIEVANLGDALLVTFTLPGSTVALHLSPDAADDLRSRIGGALRPPIPIR